MLGKVIIENGQKKIQALTADTGAGAPVGSYLYLEKKSNPQGYLYCDGSTFDETVYPALYQYLGTNVLPDWREFSAVGAEQNTTSTVIATHDVFTQGEEKDDAIQKITASWDGTIGNTHEHAPTGAVTKNGTGSDGQAEGYFFSQFSYDFDSSRVTRNDPNANVTRGKSKAVFIYIKATSGLTENQQENVLNTINENNSYSTEEHPTGAKWIDGKPIYRKVYTGIASNGTSVPININKLDKIINYDGIFYYGNPIQILKLNNPNDNGYFSRVHINGNAFNVLMGSWTDINFYITAEYTKTTD
jgi:hypothetical protein